MATTLAPALALVLVTVVISYFSIVIGELTAKRLAMQRAEAFALALAPLVAGIARMTRPVIWFLDRSTNFLVRLLGGDPHLARDQVSDEVLRAMVSSSATLGAEEQRIVDEVFDAGGRTLREVMVPRTEVDFLPADMPIAQAYREVRGAALGQVVHLEDDDGLRRGILLGGTARRERGGRKCDGGEQDGRLSSVP